MASTYGGGPPGGGPVSPIDRNPTTGPKTRKRTKTGCLTCRKRRIKCGEERPTCTNCLKSKRQCEGYNQRVVFKTPIGDWPNHPGVVSTMQYHTATLPGTQTAYRRGSNQSSHQSPNVPQQSNQQHAHAIHYEFSNTETAPIATLQHLNTQALPRGPPTYLNDSGSQSVYSPHYHQPHRSPQSQLSTPTSAAPYFQSQASHSHFPVSNAPNMGVGYEAQQRYPHRGQYQQAPVPYHTQADAKPQSPLSHGQSMYQGQAGAPTRDSYTLDSHAPQSNEAYSHYPRQRYNNDSRGLSHVEYGQGGEYAAYPTTTLAHSTHSNFVEIPQHDVDSDVKFLPQHAPALEQPTAVSKAQEAYQPQLVPSNVEVVDHVSPTQILDEAAVEYEDDDYYDVQSDEAMPDETEDEDGQRAPRDFSLIKRIHREHTTEVNIRRYDSYIYDGILTHYSPERVASPLRNPKTARVFMHFLHVTGPTLSIYERNPRNPASLYEGSAPPSQQSLWTYTLPLQALDNQGLLHAMLAMSSIHIAKLQNASVTPSWKHYSYAMKRLRRALSNPKKRLQISTLATSLLLAFYEVMTAEHVKWSTHLVGSAQLLDELDFRFLTQVARKLKAVQAGRYPYQNPGMLIDKEEVEKSAKETAMMPDARLVSTIIGKEVNYDDFGRVFEEGIKPEGKNKNEADNSDLRTYETLQDLYWWYSRQDMLQSIISGNPLIRDYRKWSDCPPRAPLGRIDTLIGTHDHLILLIGRIADFISRDRERKIAQVEANGGQWRPTPGMPGMQASGPPPSQGQGQPSQPPESTMAAGPPSHMQGMGPPPGWKGPPPPGWRGPHGPPTTSPAVQSTQASRGPPPTSGPGFYGMAPAQPPIPLPRSYAKPKTSDTPHTASQSNKSSTSHTPFSDLAAAYQSALNEWNSISEAHSTIASILKNTPTFASLTPDLYHAGPSGAIMTPFGPALRHGSYNISILWSMLHLAQILLLRSHPAMPPAAMVAASVCAPATAPYAMLIGRIAAGLPMSSATSGLHASPLTPALGAAHIESLVGLFFAGVQYQDPAQREWLITRLLEIDRQTGFASAGTIARSCETAWEKTGSVGMGPKYERRRTRRIGETERQERVSGVREDAGTRRDRSGDDRDREVEGGRSALENARNWGDEERRYVVRHRAGFVPWAMNILADEEDLRVGMDKVDISGGEDVRER